MEDYTRFVAGLEAAIEEVERLKRLKASLNYGPEYLCALDEVLIFLRPMLARAEKGRYLHPTTEVD